MNKDALISDSLEGNIQIVERNAILIANNICDSGNM